MRDLSLLALAQRKSHVSTHQEGGHLEAIKRSFAINQTSWDLDLGLPARLQICEKINAWVFFFQVCLYSDSHV